jgi:hypothetical protein
MISEKNALDILRISYRLFVLSSTIPRKNNFHLEHHQNSLYPELFAVDALYTINSIHMLSARYSVFQGFSKAKSANGGSILSSSQFLILPQLPQKIKFASKVVKVDSKIIICYLRSKSLKLTVGVHSMQLWNFFDPIPHR